METIQITHKDNKEYFDNKFGIKKERYFLPLKREVSNIRKDGINTLGIVRISNKFYKIQKDPAKHAWVIKNCLTVEEEVSDLELVIKNGAFLNDSQLRRFIHLSIHAIRGNIQNILHGNNGVIRAPLIINYKEAIKLAHKIEYILGYGVTVEQIKRKIIRHYM